jgi:hypothetical protein
VRGPFDFVHTGSNDSQANRGVTTIKDDGTIMLESWRVVPGGDDFKMMEIALTQK